MKRKPGNSLSEAEKQFCFSSQLSLYHTQTLVDSLSYLMTFDSHWSQREELDNSFPLSKNASLLRQAKVHREAGRLLLLCNHILWNTIIQHTWKSLTSPSEYRPSSECQRGFLPLIKRGWLYFSPVAEECKGEQDERRPVSWSVDIFLYMSATKLFWFESHSRSSLNSSHKELRFFRRSMLLLSRTRTHTRTPTEINSCKYVMKILMLYTIFFLPQVHLNF